ncbi:hypothetical protein ACFPPF_07185 [Xenophilus aerolatus]|nr:hypothetical protein [Xenophilus aerolatus]
MATPNYGYEKRQKELAKKKKKEDKLRAKAERKLNPGSTDGADSEPASLEQDAPATPGTPPKDD